MLSFLALGRAQKHHAVAPLRERLAPWQAIDAEPRDIGIPYRHNSLDSNHGGVVNSMLKHVKLGFGHTTEFTSYDVRDGRLTRPEAIRLVKELDGRCHPRFIRDYCAWIGIDEAQFWELAERC